MTEMDVAQLVNDLNNTVGNIQGKQELIVYFLGGAAVFIGGGIFYLARCVFSLGKDVGKMSGKLDAIFSQKNEHTEIESSAG